LNRRAFLTSASSSVALAATVGISTRKAKAQSTNPLYGTAYTVGNVTTGNTQVSATTSSANWNAYRNTIINVASDWQTNNHDTLLASYYANLQSYDCKSSYLNQAQILSDIQVTYPTVTLAQLQAAWAITDGMATSDVNEVLGAIRTGGMIQYFTSAMQQAARYSEAASGITPSAIKVVSPDWMLPPPPPPHKGGGCSDEAAFAVDSLALAFMVIGIMTGIGAIGEGLAWGAIAMWGGGGSVVMNVGQHVFC
jgi:hypothetical protein